MEESDESPEHDNLTEEEVAEELKKSAKVEKKANKNQKDIPEEAKAKAFADLKERLSNEKFTEKERHIVDESMLKRYLFANKYKVEESLQMIKGTLKWISDYKPDHIKPQEIEKDLKSGGLYRNGVDKFGNIVAYYRPLIETNSETEVKLRHIIFMMYNWIASFPPGIEKMTWIFDLQHKASSVMSVKKN